MQVTTIHFGCISQLQEMHVSIYIDGISSFPKHVHSIRQNKPFLSGPGLCSSFSHCHYRRCLLQLGGLTEVGASPKNLPASTSCDGCFSHRWMAPDPAFCSTGSHKPLPQTKYDQNPDWMINQRWLESLYQFQSIVRYGCPSRKLKRGVSHIGYQFVICPCRNSISLGQAPDENWTRCVRSAKLWASLKWRLFFLVAFQVGKLFHAVEPRALVLAEICLAPHMRCARASWTCPHGFSWCGGDAPMVMLRDVHTCNGIRCPPVVFGGSGYVDIDRFLLLWFLLRKIFSHSVTFVLFVWAFLLQCSCWEFRSPRPRFGAHAHG